MANVPPDPAAAQEAELRSEDDGMPVHPEKSEDPVAYADQHAEREREAAAGYPKGSLGRALADLGHRVDLVLDDMLAPKNRTVVVTAAVIGAVGAAILINRGGHRSRHRWRDLW